MAGRVLALCSVIAILAFAVGCSQNAQLTSIAVTPATATIPSAGQTAQFTATGTFTNAKNNKNYQENLTTQVVWSSNNTAVATINASGLATAVSQGTATITAVGGNGGLTATAAVTVTAGQNGGNTLLSITVIPALQYVYNTGETTQFIAIGNYSGPPTTQDLTNQVTWSSSDPADATINSSGLATAVGDCGSFQQTTITALAPVSSGTAVTGTGILQPASCGTNNLPTLAVTLVGQGAGVVTSSPGGIDCGSGAGCTGNFQLGANVTLTAAPSNGSIFGGFSANCTPVVPDPSSCTSSSRESGVPSCTCSVTMVDNQNVGAIFNVPQ